jgi:lactoylglutathione lyase
MTAKVHVHMHVSDLDKSREFYRVFFGSTPVKEKPGYVKFLPEWGPVNLALSQGGGPGAGPVDHLGVQLESTADVMAQLSRIKEAGLPVREEIGVNCCHANQDKFWVQDPDGVEWEVYHLNYDLEGETEAADRTERAVAFLPLAKTSSCCGPTSCAS